MPAPNLPFDPANLPKPGQPEKAEIGVERLVERYKNDDEHSAFVDALIADSGSRRLLDAIFGNSGFLGQCLLHEIPFLSEFLAHGPDTAFHNELESLQPFKTADEGQEHIMAVLRQARRRIALLTPSGLRRKSTGSGPVRSSTP